MKIIKKIFGNEILWFFCWLAFLCYLSPRGFWLAAVLAAPLIILLILKGLVFLGYLASSWLGLLIFGVVMVCWLGPMGLLPVLIILLLNIQNNNQ